MKGMLIILFLLLLSYPYDPIQLAYHETGKTVINFEPLSTHDFESKILGYIPKTSCSEIELFDENTDGVTVYIRYDVDGWMNTSVVSPTDEDCLHRMKAGENVSNPWRMMAHKIILCT
ncbi:MAG: hypothetical protein ACE5OP_04580 [Candidatus Glassbacteria bacterium]